MASFLSEHFLILVLVLASALTFLWLLQFRERLRMTWYAALLLTVLHVFYGVAAVKLFAALEGAAGGMSLFGAVFFMPLAYFAGAKITKRPLADVFDVFTPCTVVTLLCARFNCLHAGCCLGRQISLTSALRWPTREAEILFYLVFLFLLAPRIRKGQTKGEVYPIYMIAYGAFRAVVECFRVSQTSGLFHISHIWALLTLGLGLSIYVELRSRKNKKEKAKHSK